MDEEKLKKVLPFLRNADLEDPKVRREITLAVVFVILLAAFAIWRVAAGRQDSGPVTVECTDGASGTGRRSGTLELPEGEDNDILDEENMIAARERQRGERGSRLRDLYITDGGAGDDPMAVVNADPGEEAAERAVRRDDELRRMKALYGQDDGETTTEDDGPQTDLRQTRRKPVNRGGTDPVQATGGSAAPAQPQSSEDRWAEMTARASSQLEPAAPAGGDTHGGGVLDDAEEPQDAPEPARPAQVRRSGGISSLDDWGSVDGISGLDSEDQYVTIDAGAPVRVMFVKDQKVTSGQRVTLRLLDDIAAEGVLIPRNTHLSAQCSIGERLELKVNNIEINGRILGLGYTAFDNDGNEGLYCPESKEKRAAQKTQDQGLSLGASLLGSAVSGVASNIVSAGTSMVQGAGGTRTAHLSAGYTFYLLKDEY